MDRLRAIEIFIHAADAGSFYKAAIVLGITPQAVSKAIRQLESGLGIALFHRSRRNSRLTEEGGSFLERVRPGVTSVASAWELARQATAADKGVIRLTAAIGVGKNLLLPLMQAFQQDYPGIEFDVTADDRHTDIVSEGIDLGFRCGLPPGGQLVVQELMRVQLIPCASPEYLSRHGIPQSRQDLSRHACIGSRRPNTGRSTPWEFCVDGRIEFEPVHTTFRTTDVGTELEAALAGMGIGLIDSILCAPSLRSGKLVPLLCNSISERHAVYLYHTHRVDMPWRVRRFIEYATRYFKNNFSRFRVTPEELRTLSR